MKRERVKMRESWGERGEGERESVSSSFCLIMVSLIFILYRWSMALCKSCLEEWNFLHCCSDAINNIPCMSIETGVDLFTVQTSTNFLS